ncbi:MAG TPA: methyltransferase domain-containing protein [Dongiaceae bacterium]|jgi:malonyl-CoA O-methyltransferase|nr:methyltransferase domain-containing protein [Dongiaceae bacterium]
MYDKLRIARNFARAAASYDRAATVQAQAGKELAHLLRDCAPDARLVCEIGCGTGLFSGALRAAFPRIRLIVSDIAPVLAARARDRGRAELVLAMDAERPAFAAGCCDIVAGNFVAQWFTTPDSSMAGLLNLVRPGGVLGLNILLEGTFAAWHVLAGQRAVPFPSLETVRANFGSNTLLHLSERRARIACRDARQALAHIRALGARAAKNDYRPLSASKLRTLLVDPRPIDLDYRWVNVILRRG